MTRTKKFVPDTVGEWFRTRHGEAIAEIKRANTGDTLVFDPADILFLDGQRIRMLNFESDRPVLEVEYFDRTMKRFPMKVMDPVVYDDKEA